MSKLWHKKPQVGQKSVGKAKKIIASRLVQEHIAKHVHQYHKLPWDLCQVFITISNCLDLSAKILIFTPKKFEDVCQKISICAPKISICVPRNLDFHKNPNLRAKNLLCVPNNLNFHAKNLNFQGQKSWFAFQKLKNHHLDKYAQFGSNIFFP